MLIDAKLKNPKLKNAKAIYQRKHKLVRDFINIVNHERFIEAKRYTFEFPF
jgi:hypothetical protein